MTHPNEEMLKNAYDAFATGELARVTAMFSDDIAWHASGTSPVSGDYTGKDEVLQFFGKMMQTYDGTLQVQVLDILANDHHGVVLTSERGTSGGRTVEFRSVHLWTISDGRCIRFVSYEDDPYHQFWSKAPAEQRSAGSH
jgi:ketosteroid isomerase-like protein